MYLTGEYHSTMMTKYTGGDTFLQVKLLINAYFCYLWTWRSLMKKDITAKILRQISFGWYNKAFIRLIAAIIQKHAQEMDYWINWNNYKRNMEISPKLSLNNKSLLNDFPVNWIYLALNSRFTGPVSCNKS